MRNRAKCRLCNSIIESFHPTDYCVCKCDHIAVYGGESLQCSAKDWANFMRVDDEGNEIVVKVKEDDVKPLDIEKPRKEIILEELAEMIKAIENLPPQAKFSPVSQTELGSLLLLISALARAE